MSDLKHQSASGLTSVIHLARATINHQSGRIVRQKKQIAEWRSEIAKAERRIASSENVINSAKKRGRWANHYLQLKTKPVQAKTCWEYELEAT